MKLQTLETKEQAKRILHFFYSGKAFTWDIPEWEKASIKQRVDNALHKRNGCVYWFFENDMHEIVAAGAVAQTEARNGGYYVGWLAVREDYRRRGLGRKIIREIESYILSKKGWFITIDTAQDNVEANAFYKNLGYTQVGLIPNYYENGVGKVIYYKKFSP